MVVDRLMLIFFSVTILAGALYATLAAPSVTDHKIPITEKFPLQDTFQNWTLCINDLKTRHHKLPNYKNKLFQNKISFFKYNLFR